MKHKISLFICFLLVLAGCSGEGGFFPGSSGQSSQKSAADFRTGTQGLTLKFVDSVDQYVFDVDTSPTRRDNPEDDFVFSVEISNEGAYPQEGELDGRLWLSGYDEAIMEFPSNEWSLSTSGTLQGKTPFNAEGGKDIFTFEGSIEDFTKLKGLSKYQPRFLANVCYKYKTIASTPVCINPDSSSDDVCQAGTISLSSQGAPIAITEIDQRATSSQQRFTITVNNVGAGIAFTSEKDCRDADETKGFDTMELKAQNLGVGTKIGMDCRTFAGGSGKVRLVDGEGTIECTVDKDKVKYPGNEKLAYTTPITLELEYYYRESVALPVDITLINE